MSHQMDGKNCCQGKYSFRGFGRNLFNRMMNRFESRWFIVIIGEVYPLDGKRLVTFLFFFLVRKSEFPSITKKKKKKQQKMIWFCKVFFLLLMLLNNFIK